MSGFTITITDAGRAALINAQNTGTNAFVLSQIGVSTQHVTADLAALTTLPDERKRLGTMAGDVVSDDTLHVTIRDEGNDAYPMRAFGLYTSTGILFAVYSQPDPIIEKSAAAMLLLAVDAKLVALTTDQVEFGPVGFTLPPASETVAGITEVATDAETDAGTDNWRYITPRLLKRALAALSGFAVIGHKHDAADTTSGVFNVGRIPALGMEKITGLANALSGKAAEIHTHTMAQITGLVEALALKAALVHQHHADDIAQGVLAVGRIPALAMEKITGLAVALAGKLSVYPNHDIANPDYCPDGLSGGDTNLGAGLRGYAWFTRNRSQGQYTVQLALSDTGDEHFVRRRSDGLWQPWFQFHTSATFDPSLKANASAWNNADEGSTIGARKAFISSGNKSLADAQDATISLEVGCADNGAAMMTFDRRGKYGVMFGIDADNKLKIGGLAMGRNAYEIFHQGNLLAASNQDTHAGAHGADRYLTPSGLWSFAQSIGQNGYQQIPGTDLIVQWGVNYASIAEGETHAYLPTAFGGGCLFAMAIPRNPAANIGMDFYMQIAGRYLDRIVFYANRANNSSDSMSGYEWMAIGLARGNPNPPYNSGGGGGGGGQFPPDIEVP